jgi:Methyltransferase domain/Tetratricopeptide repeat
VTAEALASEAQGLLASGDAAGAIAACRRALVLDPDCLAAHVCMARARLPGDDYLVWLARFHAELAPATYLEIGVDAGRTLSLARPPTVAIGVDPAFSADPKPFAATTRTFAMESDAFFASPEVGMRLGPAPVTLAFVDGLHLFEQALRDFLHVERHAARGSVILFHDCLPLDRATSSRERRTGFWSGDVWKLLPILREHRPDLDVFVIPAYPTGLGVVTRLDPSSTLLEQRMDEITRAWTPRQWSDAPADAPVLPLVDNDGPAVLARIRGAAR